MNLEDKNIFQLIGDWLAAKRVSAEKPAFLNRNRWLPTRGNMLFTMFVALGCLLLVSRTDASLAILSALQLDSSINYQGQVSNAAGEPLNGAYSFSFTIHDALENGNLLWGPESHLNVPVNNGHFSVALGSQTDGGIPASVWDGTQYVEININGETLMPRESVLAVPKARLAFAVSDQSITSTSLADGAVLPRHFAPELYEAFSTSIVSTESTAFVPTGVSLQFDCDAPCIAFVAHRGLVMHQTGNSRVDTRGVVDGNVEFSSLGIPNNANGGNGYESVNGSSFVTLPAGNHTISVDFRCRFAGGVCYYFGGSDGGNWERLSVLVFGTVQQ